MLNTFRNIGFFIFGTISSWAVFHPTPVVPPVFHPCDYTYELGFSPPAFSCPFGTPNAQCMADAAAAYENAMRSAAFSRCFARKAADDQLAIDLNACLVELGNCTVGYHYCMAQYNACTADAHDAHDAAYEAAEDQYAQDEADAQDDYFTSALDCCPP